MGRSLQVMFANSLLLLGTDDGITVLPAHIAGDDVPAFDVGVALPQGRLY